ncbi:MAG TPA: methylated-DNA--[protein]-cysteine S-methyltransferase [Chitinophagaceae bacterium]|nr:methylated-DNA--[protein]-cysteine S-methyltransferase [Chitinophagaceae bacterium]
MTTQQDMDYQRIAKAIGYIREHFRDQPDLDEVAASIHLSPSRFQRLFTDWAGTSPKKFLQYISIEHAKTLLRQNTATPLLDAAYETGLSGSGRLHDLFITIEGMTPAEYKNDGKDLVIHYSFGSSPFGRLIVASTRKGICHMAFEEDKAAAVKTLKAKFPNASFIQKQDPLQQAALSIFEEGEQELPQIKLHLKGTAFQLKVWEALLKIPMGRLSTYAAIAKETGQPRAARAAGSAIGSNPVAYLIPCHRVIQSTGVLGGYMWGSDRKAAIIGWESTRIQAKI